MISFISIPKLLVQIYAAEIDINAVPEAIVRSDLTSLFYVFLGVVLLLAYVKLNYGAYLNTLQRAVFNTNIAQQFYRTQELSIHPAAVILFIFNILSLSVFLYLLAKHIQPITSLSNLQAFGLALSIVSFYHLFKLAVNWLITFVFRAKTALSFYQHNFFFIQVYTCIVLLPMLLLVAFSYQLKTNWIVIASSIFLIAALLFALIKGIIVNINQILGNKFYFFIYFCTLEIWPFVVAYKIADRWLIFR